MPYFIFSFRSLRNHFNKQIKSDLHFFLLTLKQFFQKCLRLFIHTSRQTSKFGRWEFVEKKNRSMTKLFITNLDCSISKVGVQRDLNCWFGTLNKALEHRLICKCFFSWFFCWWFFSCLEFASYNDGSSIESLLA